uniref:Reverse transcriptase domain-containing protein n=1 Tax=Tanacetum cinerariifolium TaxID=118510 RepID=A0A699H0D4_TANCI|nr:hypothetical protein [Tanacetum cinerariifolium]
MAASAIAISSDSSYDKTSVIAPVISSATHVVETTIVASPTGLCGLVPYSDLDSDLPDEIASLEYITLLPPTLPFLFTNSSEDSDPSEASDSSEAPPSQDPYVTIVARWRSKVMTVRKLVGPLPAHRLAWRRVSPRSSYHRPSSSSSPSDSSPVHSSVLDAPGDSSERQLDSSSHSVGLSRKRCRSPTDFLPSFAPIIGSLAPTSADLLPPRKRFRYSYSHETSMEEDTKIDTIETEDGRELNVVDGDDVRDHIEVDPRGDREEFDASDKDIVMLGIDPRSVEDMLVDLDDAIRDLYHHMFEVHVDRIVRTKTTQRELEVDQMIASGERAGMAESIRSLRTITNTRSRMTPIAIKEMINRRVTKALEAHEVNKNLIHENGNRNGNGGNGGNENSNGGNGNGNGGNMNGDGRGDMPVAHECTYQDFMKCQPLNFKGTKGVVGLLRWCEKMEIVFHISNCPERYHVKYATCTLLDSALTWWKSHKRTMELKRILNS